MQDTINVHPTSHGNTRSIYSQSQMNAPLTAARPFNQLNHIYRPEDQQRFLGPQRTSSAKRSYDQYVNGEDNSNYSSRNRHTQERPRMFQDYEPDEVLPERGAADKKQRHPQGYSDRRPDRSAADRPPREDEYINIRQDNIGQRVSVQPPVPVGESMFGQQPPVASSSNVRKRKKKSKKSKKKRRRHRSSSSSSSSSSSNSDSEEEDEGMPLGGKRALHAAKYGTYKVKRHPGTSLY